MSAIYTASAPFPPATTAVGPASGGTLTGIACAGPCVCTIANAAGTVLHSISSHIGVNETVSIAFTGGALYVTQKTPSDINFTI